MSDRTIHQAQQLWNHIPDELARDRQWAAWQWREREGKRTKVPIDVHTGRGAKSNDPATWCTLSEALTWASKHAAGVGRFFSADDPYAGVDFDTIIDPTSGEVDPVALGRIRALDSYAEISPSGTGVKVIVRAKLPPGRRRVGTVEMYDERRFWTMTGDRFEGTLATIEERQAEIEQLHRELFPATPAAPAPRPAAPLSMADREVLDRAMAAKNGAEVAALWAGDMRAYATKAKPEGDHSAADLGLLSMLAFWTQDVAQLDRLFRQSALNRPKWEERADYRQETITQALNRTDFYTPRRPIVSPTVPIPSASAKTSGTTDESRNPGAEPATESRTDGVGPIAAPADHCVGLRAERDEWRRRALAAEARADQAEAQVAQLQEERSLIFAALRNPDMKQATKTIMVTAFEVESGTSRGVDNDGWVPTPRYLIGERCGAKEDAVRRHMSHGCSAGLILERVIKRPPGWVNPVTGEIMQDFTNSLESKLVHSLHDTLRLLAGVKRNDGLQHGGYRSPRCKDHPDADVVVRTTTSCSVCGDVLSETQRVKPQDAVSDNTAPTVEDGISIDRKMRFQERGRRRRHPARRETSTAPRETCQDCGKPLASLIERQLGRCARYCKVESTARDIPQQPRDVPEEPAWMRSASMWGDD